MYEVPVDERPQTRLESPGRQHIDAAAEQVFQVDQPTVNQSSGAVGHTWPQFLPDGRRFIFYQRGATPEAQGVYVGSLDSPAIAPVLRTVSMGLYSSAHLLFAHRLPRLHGGECLLDRHARDRSRRRPDDRVALV